MKKVNLMLIVAVLTIVTSGCQTKAPVNLSAKNGNGTPALNASSAPTPTVTPPAASAADSSASAPVYSEPVAPPTNSTVNDTEAVNAAKNSDIIEIKEKMFVAQTNDVYYNAEDYLGKTIKYEGIFTAYTWEENGVTYYSVFRYGPGCCGIDSNCGFEVMWDNAYPEPDEWVEAVGVLEEYDEDGYKYLRLALTSLTVLDTRGAENVTQ